MNKAWVNNFKKRSFTALFGALVVIGCFFVFPPVVSTVLLLAAFVWIAFKELPLFFVPQTWQYWALLIFYVAVPLLAMNGLVYKNREFLLALIVLVIANDTGAYFFGSFLGKHLLAPGLSPKKTWEGLFGGMACVAVLLFIAGMDCKSVVVVAPVFSLIATAGDLFESLLKRRAGLDDSGTLLPGHGGLLDRFDSFLILFLVALLVGALLDLWAGASYFAVPELLFKHGFRIG